MTFPTVVLHPANIHFTQNSVSDTFRDGTTIDDSLNDLVRGVVNKWDIPMTKVVFRWGRWWTLNNRRLLVFKKFRRCGKIKAEIIPWARMNKELWKRKFTTENQGVFVRVRESVPVACRVMSVSVCQCSCHLYYSKLYKGIFNMSVSPRFIRNKVVSMH